MTILENIIKLHEDLIDFGSRVQKASATKIDREYHVGANVYSIFYKITAYAITLHRAVLSLCASGWTHVTAVILRTILECSVNCLAIVNNEFPEYMAFKYLYHPSIQIKRDDNYPENKREKAKIEIENAIESLNNETLKQKAIDYTNSDRIDYFWFRPEKGSVSSIINDYGSEELRFVYGSLSMSAHAGHLGLFLLKDDPDDIDINPCENPEKSKFALITSCRLLLELLYIRNVSEDLGYDSEYEEFLERIIAFKEEVRG